MVLGGREREREREMGKRNEQEGVACNVHILRIPSDFPSVIKLIKHIVSLITLLMKNMSVIKK